MQWIRKLSGIIASLSLIVSLFLVTGCAGALIEAVRVTSEEGLEKESQIWFKNLELTKTIDLIHAALKSDPNIKEVKIEKDRIFGLTEAGTKFELEFSTKETHTGVVVRVGKGLMGLSHQEGIVVRQKVWNIINQLAVQHNQNQK